TDTDRDHSDPNADRDHPDTDTDRDHSDPNSDRDHSDPDTDRDKPDPDTDRDKPRAFSYTYQDHLPGNWLRILSSPGRSAPAGADLPRRPGPEPSASAALQTVPSASRYPPFGAQLHGRQGQERRTGLRDPLHVR
ncbi:MAG TPA: hypothetical protein VI365_02165, partial [Trebonia sp.]